MSGRPRVLYLTHSIDPNGGGMERMGHALVSRGSDRIDFVVVASEGLDALPAHVTTVHLPLPSRPAFARIALFYARSGALVRRWRSRVDVVHSCGAITRERVDLSTVHLVHAAVTSSSREDGKGWRKWNAALARYVGRRTERRQFRASRTKELVAVSQQVSAQLSAQYRDVPHRTINNGVDAHRFVRDDRGPRDSEQLRVVMVTGDFTLKGVDLALDVTALVPAMHLTVVGDGPREDYARRAHERGVSDRVTFAGFVRDVAPVYREHDVVLCLSHYESFGLFLVEAALSGCAVVSTDVGVAASLIGENQGGRLVVRSLDAVAEGLRELANDRHVLEACADVAYERALEFSLDRMVDDYVALYEEVARA